MLSLGAARCVSLFVIALLGVLGRAFAPEADGSLPDLADQPLIEEWGMLYDVVRQFCILGAIAAVLAACVQQVREEVDPCTLVLVPIAVLVYLALLEILPEDSGYTGSLLVMAGLLAICLGAWADLQPEERGRPAYYSALGMVLAMVIYVGGMEQAAAVPGLVMGEAPDPRVRWGLELLAVLVVPVTLTFLPGLKLAWQRPARGAWWS